MRVSCISEDNGAVTNYGSVAKCMYKLGVCNNNSERDSASQFNWVIVKLMANK